MKHDALDTMKYIDILAVYVASTESMCIRRRTASGIKSKRWTKKKKT